MTELTFRVLTFGYGQRVWWHATVSNYGHQQDIPARVLSLAPKRCYIETEYGDGRPERRVRVKYENLRARSRPEGDTQ